MSPEHEEVLEETLVRYTDFVRQPKPSLQYGVVPRSEASGNRGIIELSDLSIFFLADSSLSKFRRGAAHVVKKIAVRHGHPGHPPELESLLVHNTRLWGRVRAANWMCEREARHLVPMHPPMPPWPRWTGRRCDDTTWWDEDVVLGRANGLGVSCDCVRP